MKVFIRAWILASLMMVAAVAQGPAPDRAWRYEALADTTILDDCPICGRPAIFVPLRGSFSLVGTATANQFRIENIQFVSDFSEAPEYRITGSGTVTIGGGAPASTFQLLIQRKNFPDETLRFNNDPLQDNSRIFPMLSMEADEDTQSLTRVYRIRIAAAPIRAMWFSTANGMTPANPGIGRISGGDVLSIDGSVFKRYTDIVQRLSIPPEEFGLDALDLGPRGEILFSLERDTDSVVNGPIGHGSLASSEGRVILHNHQLLSAFNVTDQTDAGLDALHVMPNEEYYFSINTPVTRASGGTLRSGDLLSTQGRIVRTEQSLMARWQNPLVESVGVDAFFVWPNGEVWFSLQNGLNSQLGVVQRGDIISDQGYFVFRNLEILAPFAPLEDLADFGLDALTIISDVNPAPGPPRLDIELTDEGVNLNWSSASGRVFQLQKATTPEGPWSSLTEITIARGYFDEGIAGAAYYRLLQW